MRFWHFLRTCLADDSHQSNRRRLRRSPSFGAGAIAGSGPKEGDLLLVTPAERRYELRRQALWERRHRNTPLARRLARLYERLHGRPFPAAGPVPALAGQPGIRPGSMEDSSRQWRISTAAPRNGPSSSTWDRRNRLTTQHRRARRRRHGTRPRLPSTSTSTTGLR